MTPTAFTALENEMTRRRISFSAKLSDALDRRMSDRELGNLCDEELKWRVDYFRIYFRMTPTPSTGETDMSTPTHIYVYEFKMVATVTVQAADAGKAEAIADRGVANLGYGISPPAIDGLIEVGLAVDGERGPFLVSRDGETA